MPEAIRPDETESQPTLEGPPRGVGAPLWLQTVTARWFVKVAFLLVFVAAVVQLLLFARWARGDGPFVPRPEAVAGLLPIGHFTSFFGWLRGGGWDTLLPAGLVIIMMALLVSLLFKRAFCGWICPVGTVWEAFSSLGRRLMGSNIRVPRWLDLVGRGFRYLLAAAFLAVLMAVPVQEAVAFRSLPYMWIADLKILSLMIEPMWLVVAALAAVLSVLFGPVWCRYLCPLGGLYSAVGVASLCAVERDSSTCISCGRCTASCHAFVEPHKAGRVWAPECDGCMDCVKVCPVEDCLEARVARSATVRPWVWPVLVVAVWLSVFGIAKFSGNWDSTVPPELVKQVIQSGLVEQRTRGFFE